ncbi:MAG TPA: 50S ribosomal protein L19e [Candidatus Nanoarchaeia archaeon]|nr:50S ribosomal protein L19e [Candidatus Nanoarchaeia archaeon]
MISKKRLAAKILKTSPQKIKFSEEALGEIQKAITRSDIRGLIAVGKIVKVNPSQQSRGRARETMRQKSKGRQKGKGSRKGSQFAREDRKRKWINRVRVQREFLKELIVKSLITTPTYRELYQKVKGGFFRNKRHIKLYLTEYKLIQKK